MLEAIGKAKKALALWFPPRPTRGRLLADNGNLAVGTCGSGGLHGDRTGGQFLGYDHRKSLHAALGPVIDAREDSVLMVEIVVQNGDERGIECEVLLEGAGALHLQRDTGDAVGEEDVGAVRFFRLGAPVITDGRAIALQRQ